MRRVVFVSATYIDTVLTVPQFPSEDDKLRASSLVKRRGGNGANTAEVLQQLLVLEGLVDVAIMLFSVLPAKTCAASKMIRESLPGVDCSHCIYRNDCDQPASSYILRSQTTGSRTSVSHSDLREMTTAEFTSFADALAETACWYHFEGRTPETLAGCIAHLRQRWPHAKISLELENPNRLGLHQLMVSADVLFFSRTWAQAHGFESAKTWIERTRETLGDGPTLVFCTWGSAGADALACKGEEPIHADGLHVDPANVVDTIGAGDTFIAGVLVHLLRSTSAYCLADVLSFATDLASRKIQSEGFRLFD